jgi:hypothetical protein
MSSKNIIFLLAGIICVVGLIALVKAGGGLRKSDSTGQRESLSQTFSMRKMLAQFIGIFAVICFVGGAMSLFQRDGFEKVDWRIAVGMIALSQFLMLCVWLLGRKKK